jgi:hypothetical protein
MSLRMYSEMGIEPAAILILAANSSAGAPEPKLSESVTVLVIVVSPYNKVSIPCLTFARAILFTESMTREELIRKEVKRRLIKLISEVMEEVIEDLKMNLEDTQPPHGLERK